MNSTNSMNFPNVKLCFTLRTLGYPQAGASAYWAVKEKKVYAASAIHKFAGWEKFYVAAPTDPELNAVLPAKFNGASLVIIKEKSGLWSAGYPEQLPSVRVVSFGASEIEAKCLLLKRLLYKKLIIVKT